MKENFPKPTTSSEKESALDAREKILTHHAEYAITAFEKYAKENNLNLESVETVRRLFETLTEQGIRNSAVFEAKEVGASFPWTVVRVGDIARELQQSSDKIPAAEKNREEAEDAGAEKKSKKEFVFGTFLNPQNGNQFCFFEEVMHQVVARLPRALEALSERRDPESDELYVLGSPSNEYGSVSDEFVEAMHGDHAFEQFGKAYAVFVDSVLSADKVSAKTDVLFSGLSMGGSLAAETAAQVLKDGIATQSQDERDIKPFLNVRLDVPVGPSDLPTSRKRWQLPAGFALDGLYNLLTNPYARTATFREKPFMDKVDTRMAEQGISKNMSKEQEALKKEAIAEIIGNLRDGVPLPPEVRSTEVVGMYDPAMFQTSALEKAKTQREEHKGSLGAGLVSDTPEHRKFAIAMGHSVPFFRENEMHRIAKTANAIDELQSVV